MNKKALAGISVVLGIILIIAALVYWFVPAGSLPAFMPGYEAGSSHIHVKHGLGSFILALALFALAWFKTGTTDTPASMN